MTTLKFHPLSDLFPLLEGVEFDELVADIKKNRLRDKIVLYHGMILDGRNRYRALRTLGVDPEVIRDQYCVEPHCIDANHGGPRAYVISANIHRRHLTAEQKREIIAELIKATPEKSDRAIADEMKVDKNVVSRMRKKTEATGAVAPVEKRTGKDGKARKQPAKKPKSEAKQPAPKPLKPDPRIISPKLADRVGRFANDLILCDRLLAIELNNLIMLPGVRERLSADLTNGLALDDSAEPKGDDAL